MEGGGDVKRLPLYKVSCTGVSLRAGVCVWGFTLSMHAQGKVGAGVGGGEEGGGAGQPGLCLEQVSEVICHEGEEWREQLKCVGSIKGEGIHQERICLSGRKKKLRKWMKYQISRVATTDLVAFSNQRNHSGVSQKRKEFSPLPAQWKQQGSPF